MLRDACTHKFTAKWLIFECGDQLAFMDPISDFDGVVPDDTAGDRTHEHGVLVSDEDGPPNHRGMLPESTR